MKKKDDQHQWNLISAKGEAGSPYPIIRVGLLDHENVGQKSTH